MIVYAAIPGAGFGGYLTLDYVQITRGCCRPRKNLGIINVTTTLPPTIGVAIGRFLVTDSGGYGALFPAAMAFVIIGALCPFRIRGVR